MWQVESVELVAGRARRYLFKDMAYYSVLEAWKTDSQFRQFFNSLLAESEFQAFTWETPPVSGPSLEQPFEFVLIKSRRLVNLRTPSASKFSDKLKAEPNSPSVVIFPNLNKDALFVAPCPAGKSNKGYAHLGDFVRFAPEEQKHELWKQLAKAVEQKISINPLWLSTSKLGVKWLHVRVDSKAKHYRHTPYTLLPQV